MKGSCIWCSRIDIRILLQILCLSDAREKKKHERENDSGEFHQLRLARLDVIPDLAEHRYYGNKNVTNE